MATNDFFDDADWSRLVANTLARAEAVNAIADGVVVGFGRLPAQAALYEDRVSFGTDSGLVNAYIVTLPYTFTLTNGARFRFRPNSTNTTAATCNPNSLGVLQIVNYAGTALTGGELISGVTAQLEYNSTSNHLRIVQPLTSVGSVTTFDINSMSTGSVVDPTADYVPMYDASLGAQVKVLVSLISDEYQNALKSQFYAGVR